MAPFGRPLLIILLQRRGGGKNEERRAKNERRSWQACWDGGEEEMEREALGQWGKGQKKTNRERCAVKKEEWNPGDQEHNAAGEIRNDI